MTVSDDRDMIHEAKWSEAAWMGALELGYRLERERRRCREREFDRVECGRFRGVRRL